MPKLAQLLGQSTAPAEFRGRCQQRRVAIGQLELAFAYDWVDPLTRRRVVPEGGQPLFVGYNFPPQRDSPFYRDPDFGTPQVLSLKTDKNVGLMSSADVATAAYGASLVEKPNLHFDERSARQAVVLTGIGNLITSIYGFSENAPACGD